MGTTCSRYDHRGSPSCPSIHPQKKLSRKYLSRKFSDIDNQYQNLAQVRDALRQKGLPSSRLIVGFDFTKSNEWTGTHSYHGRSLHALGDEPNPYEQAISIIGKTLAVFDEDNLIPCFGFGDASTQDQAVFSFYPGNRPCQGFDDALARYRQMVPNLKLSGPTSFAPIIEAAVTTVQESGGQFHVLVIIADGQVTSCESLDSISRQERATMDAIVAASKHPLSIVLVGVGDGPWYKSGEFYRNIPNRDFENFHFVHFSGQQKKATFALAALEKIPSQFRAAEELKLLGKKEGCELGKRPLPPPQAVLQADLLARGCPRMDGTALSTGDVQAIGCPVCISAKKDMVFGCGHQTCQDCGKVLQDCPFCRREISLRIVLL